MPHLTGGIILTLPGKHDRPCSNLPGPSNTFENFPTLVTQLAHLRGPTSKVFVASQRIELLEDVSQEIIDPLPTNCVSPFGFFGGAYSCGRQKPASERFCRYVR